ncbi:hypothetical protein [Fimbriiglobus ruber]|uniref:Uncharacterized protein n=1 Tax=Fimbriiglobus ruber TaxID=1908690 RepID=A0A225DMS8_9BACT|nr:hypothetical protein [Fimbriiglobus ruber]OWK40934.1 hypothetical protein FRUB_04826 [Fimbriiglobus ruber]
MPKWLAEAEAAAPNKSATDWRGAGRETTTGLAGNKTTAKESVAEAFQNIQKAAGQNHLEVEQPFVSDCLMAELEAVGAALGKQELDARVKLLKRLRGDFSWALPLADRDRVDAFLAKQ